jgi:hypothetical protein
MAVIVGVHGINQQLKGSELLHQEWWPALKDGARNAGRELGAADLTCAFYGGLFRDPDEVRRGDEQLDAADVTDAFDVELLDVLWKAAALNRDAFPPDADARWSTPSFVQKALTALSGVRCFVGVAEHALIGSLRQVRRYMHEPEIRRAAQLAVHNAVGPSTRVLVAHSLGTVVAYEALHAYADKPNWQNVNTLVTLGSPLGISNLIFDALTPAPRAGMGLWPRLIKTWTNISDDGDVVALEKQLKKRFGDGVVDIRISNECRAHDASAYLTAPSAGKAIADGF